MKNAKLKGPKTHAEPSDDVIREYAYHLYAQSSREDGHDVDNWLEARACLKANIPTRASRTRLHRHING
jgi:hypothetical protein